MSLLYVTIWLRVKYQFSKIGRKLGINRILVAWGRVFEGAVNVGGQKNPPGGFFCPPTFTAPSKTRPQATNIRFMPNFLPILENWYLTRNHMVTYNRDMDVEQVFKALADHHRRHLLDILAQT